MIQQQLYLKKMMSSVVQIGGKQYKITGIIGQGAAAVVYLAKDARNNSYALKMIKNYNDPIIKEMVDAEIRIQKEFQGNKYVIQYIGFLKTSNFVYLVLQLGECSLRHWIDTNREIWQVELIKIICDVCQGLIDIHHKKFIHRDIKPQNIIKKDNLYKITDFGVSCQNQQDESVTGTPLYWAPQILFGQSEKFTNKIDVWSFGVTIFEVYFKVNPFCPDKKLDYKYAIEEVKKNIKQLTPKFSMKRYIEFLKKRKFREEVDYIQKKLKNTDISLVQNMCLFFEPSPDKRPDMDLLFVLFESLRGSIQMPQIKKTQKVQKFRWEEIPQDIRLFCKCKDLFYEIAAYLKTKLYQNVIFALQLCIWYLQGANYGGIYYINLDQIDKIKEYRKPAPQLWNQVKTLLSEYYFYLKCEEEAKMYEKINEVRMHILVCSVWWSIMKDDRYFCKRVSEITGLEIEHPFRMFSYMQMYSEKNIAAIEEQILDRYHI